jgi:hypothetical protein
VLTTRSSASPSTSVTVAAVVTRGTAVSQSIAWVSEGVSDSEKTAMSSTANRSARYPIGVCSPLEVSAWAHV